MLLEIQDLHASIDGTPILKGINLQVKLGEIHIFMGPNGSGKSTFSKVVLGHPSYKTTRGQIFYTFRNKKILLNELPTYERACKGIFLSLQHPTEITGITNYQFLKESFNLSCKAHGAGEMNDKEFKIFIAPKLERLKMDPKFLDRSLNEGFSGGEKKKNEILQMSILNPALTILDETDSGLDIDALQEVAAEIMATRTTNNSLILITHYQRLLDYVIPDFVHIFYDGKIIKSGAGELVQEIEEKGYDWIHKNYS